MVERWNFILGYKNYQASSLGRIRRATSGKGTRLGKIRALPVVGNYQYVDLYEEGVHTRLYVHIAVLLAFKGKPPTKKHQGAHRDGKTFNNKLANLRWATPKENDQDKDRHGTRPIGSKHKNAKLTEANVRTMRQLRKAGKTLEALAARYGVCMQNVDFICRWKTWGHVHA